MINLIDFIFEAKGKYTPEQTALLNELKPMLKMDVRQPTYYGNILFVHPDIYDGVINNYTEIPSDQIKGNRWYNIANFEGDPVISVAINEPVYRKPNDRDLYYTRTTSAVEKKTLKKIESENIDLLISDSTLCPGVSWGEVRDVLLYAMSNFNNVRDTTSGDWKYIVLNNFSNGGVFKNNVINELTLTVAYNYSKKQWKFASDAERKDLQAKIAKKLGSTSSTNIQPQKPVTVTKPATIVTPKPVQTIVKPAPVKAAPVAKTPVRKTPKYYQELLSRAIKSNNIIDLKAALKEIIIKFGKQSMSYKDEIWLRIDSETLGDFWNSYPEAFIYDEKRKNVFVSIYWQGASTDGNKEIPLDDLWRNERYVFRVTHSYGNGDYNDDRIYVEKKDIIEILNNLAKNWLSSKEIKKRKEIADAKARIAPLAAAVDDLLGNELFRKYGGRGGSMTPTDHMNGKEAAKEWFAKNKEELAKKNVSVEQVKDMARKVYMNNKKPDSYFYEVNRYGWRGKKLRDYNLDL